MIRPERLASRLLIGLAVGLALSGASVAQRPEPSTSAGLSASRVAAPAISTSQATPAPAPALNGISRPAPGVAPAPLAGEPPALAGLLDAVNAMRRRISAPPVGWSDALAMQAASIAAEVEEKGCSRSSAFSAAGKLGASVYFAPSLRSIDGSSRLQDIKPAFVADEWRAWGATYDETTRACSGRKSGDCASYARLVAPTARTVGCARLICPSKAQVWTCVASE